MKIFTLRDSSEARRFLVQGLWWQRVQPPSAATTSSILGWAKVIVSEGQPLPPLGFVADLGHVALGEDRDDKASRETMVPFLPINLLRTYEDHLLGKLYADWTFGRASDALRRYAMGRDRSRGLAYLLGRFQERASLPGVELSPGVINAALDSPAQDLLAEGWNSLQQNGPHPWLAEMYEEMIAGARRVAEVLGPEDLFELESGGALEEASQRLARRQVLQAAAALETALPRNKMRPMEQRREVPTRILDDDAYPVGGFTSLSNRGSVESLLHSQLAYMEPKEADRPDLFDVKFLRDELLYYARDENHFLRRRRTFVFLLQADLEQSRFKDADLPYQRIVMLLAILVTAIRRLSEWLSEEALTFHFLFVGESAGQTLTNERALLQTVLREQIAAGAVTIDQVPAGTVATQCEEWDRKSLVHILSVGVDAGTSSVGNVSIDRLAIASSRPALSNRDDRLEIVEGEDAVDSWANSLRLLLERWV
jgi:hypothetical protein